MQSTPEKVSQDVLTRRAANRVAKWVLIVLGVVVLLWVLVTAPFWLFALGWYDSTRVSRYGEFLGYMPPELAHDMPQSVPSSATGVRMHYHAGMLQARHWLELRFVVPTNEAVRIAGEASKVQDTIEANGGDNKPFWLRHLSTLDDQNDKTPPPETIHCYMLARARNNTGFAAVAVDTVTGEVVYVVWPD